MISRRLAILIFGGLLFAAIFLLRLVLHTRPGVVVLAAILVFQLLRFFYRSMGALTITLWEISAKIAEWLQQNRGRRSTQSTQKEAGHAARLL
jgi:hypothetical protein